MNNLTNTSANPVPQVDLVACMRRAMEVLTDLRNNPLPDTIIHHMKANNAPLMRLRGHIQETISPTPFATFSGIRIYEDPLVEPDTLHFYNSAGELLHKVRF